MALDTLNPAALVALALLVLLPLTALAAVRAVRRGALPLRAWSAPAVLSVALAGILAMGVEVGLSAMVAALTLVPVMALGLTRGRPGAAARWAGAALAVGLLGVAPRVSDSIPSVPTPGATVGLVNGPGPAEGARTGISDVARDNGTPVGGVPALRVAAGVRTQGGRGESRDDRREARPRRDDDGRARRRGRDDDHHGEREHGRERGEHR